MCGCFYDSIPFVAFPCLTKGMKCFWYTYFSERRGINNFVAGKTFAKSPKYKGQTWQQLFWCLCYWCKAPPKLSRKEDRVLEECKIISLLQELHRNVLCRAAASPSFQPAFPFQMNLLRFMDEWVKDYKEMEETEGVCCLYGGVV